MAFQPGGGTTEEYEAAKAAGINVQESGWLDRFNAMGATGDDVGNAVDEIRGGNDIFSSPDAFKNFYNGLGVASSGFDTDFDVISDNIRTDEERRLKNRREEITGIYGSEKDRVLEETRQIQSGERTIGGQRGGAGQSGLGFSSVTEARITLEKERSDKAIKELTKLEEQSLARADTESADRIRASINDEIDRRSKLRQQEFDNTMKLLGFGIDYKREQRAERNEELDKAVKLFGIAKDIPEGESLDIGGGITIFGVKRTDPFFNSTNLVTIMGKIPMGQEFTLEDPNTGQIWTLTGIAQPSENLKQYTATDDRGTVRIINFDPTTGEIVSVAELPGAGKTKSSTTINIGAQSGAGLTMADFNKQGYRRVPKEDGGFDFKDPKGKVIDVVEAAKATGVPVPVLLAGSTDPDDLDIIRSANPNQDGGFNLDSIDIEALIAAPDEE